MSPSKETDIFVELKEKMSKMNQEILLRSKNGIEQSKFFIDLFKENVDWEKKFQSIVDELDILMKTHSSIIKLCKSISRQHAGIFGSCCDQLKCIQSILESGNNNLDEERLNSIELARNTISENFAQIELIKDQAKQAFENKTKTLELNKELVQSKIESKNEVKNIILDYLKKRGLKFTIGAISIGALVGAACGTGILIANIIAGGYSICALTSIGVLGGACCVAGVSMSPFIVVGVPIAIGAILFGGIGFGIAKYITYKQKEKNKKILDHVQKNVEENVENASKDVENKFSAFRKSQESLESIMDKFPETQNGISSSFKDLKLIIENKYQRDFFLNSEKISEIINNWEKMKSLLDEIINFVE